MAPKRDRASAPPSTFLGPSAMMEDMVKDRKTHGIINPGAASAPSSSEVRAHPEDNEVIVFRDFFPADLRFPLDPTVVAIFEWYGVYLH